MASAAYVNLKMQQGHGLQQLSLQHAAYSQPVPRCAPSQLQDFGQGFQLTTPQFQQPAYGPASTFAQHAIQTGMPDPESIAKQKATYANALQAEEIRTIEGLEQQRKQHLATIYEQAEQHRQQMLLQIEHQVKHMEMSLANDFTQQVTQTKQQYNDLRSALEQQAIQLTAEVQKKLVQEAAMQQQAKLRQEKAASELVYMGQMQRLQQPAHIFQTPSYVPPVVQANSGSYVPPPCDMSQPYCAAPGVVHTGSYVPPPVGVAQMGSYVPPPAVNMGACGSYVPLPVVFVPNATGSYVPPPASIAQPHCGGVQTGSYVPPAMVFVPNAGGSYVPAPTVFSGVPATIVMAIQ